MARHTRCQGAIMRDHHILLITHQEHSTGRKYWLVPGGGIEDGEDEVACVIREMREETNLEVRVERLLLDEEIAPSVGYTRIKTYLCVPIAGEAKPGYEPEEEASSVYGITDVAWFDLRDESSWNGVMKLDEITYPQVKRIQKALGYT